jgi:DNA-binding transcriptional regulator GbsR (MarR family)
MNVPRPEIGNQSEASFRYREGLADVFAELADLFGNPRSHGLIYGILFSSSKPLSMDEIADRLAISKGSASQGLRALEELGAVIRQADGRTGTYSAKLELKNLISGFVNSRLIPRLEASREKLQLLRTVLDVLPPAEIEEATWRLARVAQWHDRAALFLPFAEKLLQSAAKLDRRSPE